MISFHFVTDVFVPGVGGQAGIFLCPVVRQSLEILSLVIKCLESNLVWDVANGYGERHPFIPERKKIFVSALSCFP